MSLCLKSYAKVNLHLEVLHQREDGYHEVETVLQTIELHDILRITLRGHAVHVKCSHPAVPTDRSNLCHRAAVLIRKHLGIREGVQIELEKHIPVSAGLGGGSSNAAAVLVALQKMWGVELETEDLLKIASDLGADVPFFLKGGTQLARGIGDVLTPMNSSGQGCYLVITPDFPLSTASIFAQLRMGLTRVPPKVSLQTYKAILSRFPERDWPGFNRLSDVVYPDHPALHRLYLDLLETEPKVAMLSGSGPSLYAVYPSRELAEEARDSLNLKKAFSWVGGSTRQALDFFTE